AAFYRSVPSFLGIKSGLCAMKPSPGKRCVYRSSDPGVHRAQERPALGAG
ncbi:unnamed protein product, partial [Ectocarpus sp. 12 AP-2014]